MSESSDATKKNEPSAQSNQESPPNQPKRSSDDGASAELITKLAKEEFYYTRQLKTLLGHYIEMMQNHLPKDLRDHLKALLAACATLHTKISARLEFRKARKVTSPSQVGELFIHKREDFNLTYPALTSKILQLRTFIASEAYPTLRRKIEELDIKSPMAPTKFDRLLDRPLERIEDYTSFFQKLGEANKGNSELFTLAREALMEINENMLQIRNDHIQIGTIVNYEKSITGLPVQKKNVLIEYGKFIKGGKINFRFGPEAASQERLCLLFDFILVICTPLSTNNYSFRGSLIVNDIESSSTGPSSTGPALSTASPVGTKNVYLKHRLCQCTHVMSVGSEDEKESWLRALEQAKDNGNPAPVRTGSVKHGFVLKTFALNTHCDHCYKILNGFFYQGYQCFKCGLMIHKDCMGHENLAKCRIPKQ